MSKIPLNATLEEVIEYHLPPEYKEAVESRFEKFLDKRDETEAELEKVNEEFENIEEQDGFKTELLETIQTLCRRTGNKRELIASIKEAFDDSQVEM